VADIERLARTVGGELRVDVELSGEFDDLNPSVGVALYRIAQEAVPTPRATPAMRPGSTSTPPTRGDRSA